MLRLRTLSIGLALASLVGTATPLANGTALHGMERVEVAPSSPDVVLSESALISGTIHVSSLKVREGAVLYADRDLEIISAGPIQIDGSIVAIGTGGWDGLKGHDIVLVSESSIQINGHLRAGDGANGPAVFHDGGKGGDLILQAPVSYVSQERIIAGKGGDAGPGAAGGRGGDVVVLGAIRHTDRVRVELVGGEGGRGGVGINGLTENSAPAVAAATGARPSMSRTGTLRSGCRPAAPPAPTATT